MREPCGPRDTALCTVSGPSIGLPWHALIPASVPETKRVFRTLPCLTARFISPSRSSNTHRRGFRAGSRRQELRDQEVQLCKGRTHGGGFRQHGGTHDGKKARTASSLARIRASTLPGAIPDSFLDALTSIPTVLIDFYSLTSDDKTFGFTAHSAAITTAEFIFLSPSLAVRPQRAHTLA